ncbi:MAG TPA: GNAT family N-acetyltransferase [Candidatus Acidoferrum sp.]|nr:GNAT family N-acetyltransferase [Candidatus Acidoferrum sp.]
MEDLQIAFQPYADQATKDIVVNGVDYHNIATTGHAACYPVAFFLRDGREEVLGGLLGEIWGGSMYVTHLWVAEPARGAGHGTRLLQAAERYALERGCHGAFLGSFSFQAPAFYQKQGYQVFGVLDDHPPGHKLFFLKKALRAGPG